MLVDCPCPTSPYSTSNATGCLLELGGEWSSPSPRNTQGDPRVQKREPQLAAPPHIGGRERIPQEDRRRAFRGEGAACEKVRGSWCVWGMPRSPVSEPGRDEGRNQIMQGLESQAENLRLCAEVIGAKSFKRGREVLSEEGM